MELTQYHYAIHQSLYNQWKIYESIFFENKCIYKEVNEKFSIKRTGRIIATVIFIVLLLIIIGVWISNEAYMESYLEEVPLELTDDHIKLEYGSAIYFMDYIKNIIRKMNCFFQESS